MFLTRSLIRERKNFSMLIKIHSLPSNTRNPITINSNRHREPIGYRFQKFSEFITTYYYYYYFSNRKVLDRCMKPRSSRRGHKRADPPLGTAERQERGRRRRAPTVRTVGIEMTKAGGERERLTDMFLLSVKWATNNRVLLRSGVARGGRANESLRLTMGRWSRTEVFRGGEQCEERRETAGLIKRIVSSVWKHR